MNTKKLMAISLVVMLGLVACGSDDSASAAPISGNGGSTSSFAYGQLLDARDGQVYKTIQMGNQVWMAQNLKYKTPYDIANSVETYSEHSGEYYYSFFNANKSACPLGWHVPDTTEWNILFETVGGGKRLLVKCLEKLDFRLVMLDIEARLGGEREALNGIL